jgi:dUTP pyrophosphatase
MILNFSRVHPDVILPTRANPSDAGLDLYYCPLDNDGVMLKPGQTALFGTGIRIEIPHGYYFEIKNRSGNAYKRQLLVGACVVDSGYSGEIFINLHNVGETNQRIEPGMKIAQGILLPAIHLRLREVDENELYNDVITFSNRGEGALGSTGG